jgi:hypothetical protein
MSSKGLEASFGPQQTTANRYKSIWQSLKTSQAFINHVRP